MNDFERDMVFSKEYHPLLAHFYERLFHEGRYVFIDKSRFSLLVQTQLKADVIGQTRSGSVGIEEKFTRWPVSGRPFVNFFLETESCTVPGRESQGWMQNGEADYLLYVFETQEKGLDIYLIPFQELKTWFWKAVERHPDKYHEYTMPDTTNHTRGRLVPIIDILRYVPATRRYHLRPDGSCKRIATSLTSGRSINEPSKPDLDKAS